MTDLPSQILSAKSDLGILHQRWQEAVASGDYHTAANALLSLAEVAQGLSEALDRAAPAWAPGEWMEHEAKSWARLAAELAARLERERMEATA